MPDDKEIPASTPASAEQPGSTVQNFQSLQMLRSKQSAKISTFKVIVCNPWNDNYPYQWKGKPIENTTWRCVLVSADDPAEYCNAEYKLTTRNNKTSVETHVKAYRHGTTVVMKAVTLVEDAKTQYNSCSVRVTVNMASTTLSKV